MKSIIDVDYVQTADGKYIGWAVDYKAVVVQGDDLVDVRKKIMLSLKILFLHFVDKINDDTLSVHCNEHKIPVIDKLQHLCGLQGFGAIDDVCPACDERNK